MNEVKIQLLRWSGQDRDASRDDYDEFATAFCSLNPFEQLNFIEHCRVLVTQSTIHRLGVTSVESLATNLKRVQQNTGAEVKVK